MVSLNQIYLLGNLTKDPELKYTNEGMAIAEIGIAVNKKWKDSTGEDNVTVDYFNITAWNALAENCANSLKKGDRVLVGGHVNLRTWENREGKKYNIINITADVVALSFEFSKSKNDGKKSKKSEKSENNSNLKAKNDQNLDSLVIEEKTYED
jgi:single-strand DNA-binding protein